VAKDFCWPCRPQRSADGNDDRQHSGEGTPLVRRRTQVAGKKGDQEQAIGRSRGGRTTKIHAIVDDKGRPHALLLTGGNVADITGASQLLAATEPSQELIADKAYDADHLRAFLQARGTLVVIPNKSTLSIRRGQIQGTQYHRAQHRPDQGLSCDRHSL
jgi:transposase